MDLVLIYHPSFDAAHHDFDLREITFVLHIMCSRFSGMGFTVDEVQRTEGIGCEYVLSLCFT